MLVCRNGDCRNMMSQSIWSSFDKGPNIDIVNDDIIQFHGQSGHGESVRTAEPIPSRCTYYYYEIQIMTTEGTDGVTMGLSSHDLGSNPSEKSKKKFQANEHTSIFTPKQYYTFDDAIGCYVDLNNSSYFFTMNGKIMCEPISYNMTEEILYPTVSLSQDGDIIRINFKEEACKFNVTGIIVYHYQIDTSE